MDAICGEPQFVVHAAPVWAALPPEVRGRFRVMPELVDQVRALGIEPDVIDGDIRLTPQVPANPGDGPTALVTSMGDIKVGRRLGYRRFVFMEHGAGQSYEASWSSAMTSYPGGPDRTDCALFLMPNEYSASRWRAAYPSAVVEVVGSPRLGTIPGRESGPPTVAISWHFDGPNMPYAGTALPDYAPQLTALAERFRLIGHAHPKPPWPERMARMYRKLGIEFVADFDEVCRRADVYVCDNSSTIFEFASTGRPVVLMNARAWSRKGGPGLRFWEASGVGINVWPQDDLGDAVAEALRDEPERQMSREAALRVVYAFPHGAAERAATAIVAWLGARETVAA